MAELNLAGNEMGKDSKNWDAKSDTSGVAALADVIPGMGAIVSVNLLKNNIPVEQAQELVKIMQSKEELLTLCGLSKEETELDFSRRGQRGQRLCAGDAVLLANDISDMGDVSLLNLAGNTIGGYYSANGFVGTPKGRLQSVV
jgi:hypothetical protein